MKSSARKTNDPPDKAIVLAAGLAERMRPLTSNTPKAMMPFAGKPIINHVLSNLHQWGVKDILINLHHAPAPLIHYLQKKPFAGLKISLSFEPDICGTGGALRRAAWFIDNEPCWLVNSDIVFEFNPASLLDDFFKHQPLACLWVTKSCGPRTVEIRNGRISCFASTHPGTADTATFAGVHLISSRILNYIPNRTYSSIIEAYNTALENKDTIIAAEDDSSYWADIGSPEKLLAAHLHLCSPEQKHLKLHQTVRSNFHASKRIIKNKGAKVCGFVSCADSLSISGAPSIENAVLETDIQLGPLAVISNCIVASGSSVNTRISRAASPLTDALDAADIHAMRTNGFKTRNKLSEALPPRGSDRSFYRLHDKKNTCILLKYKTVRTENARFTGHLKLLEQIGFPVPRLLLDLKDRNLCVVEDLGGSSMQNMFDKMSPEKISSLYSRVIEYTALLHSKGTQFARKKKHALEPPFNNELYLWEHKLFAEHYLTGRLHLNSDTILNILKELSIIANKLQRISQVLVHRDLQSSNIILKQGRPVFIDFQGMRMGSRFYDLASLIFDPYISLPGGLKESLIEQYSAASGISPSTAVRMTRLAGIQRLAQALGAYSRLAKIEGMSSFSEHIKPAVRNMCYCLETADFLPELSAVMQEQI